MPTKAQLNTLLNYYKTGLYTDAEKLAISIIQEFPLHQLAWKVMGGVLAATGRNPESENAYREAVKLAPQDAEAHNELGIILQDLGKLEDAEFSLRQAIILRPESANFYNNMGILFISMERFDKASENFRKAIILRPDFAEALNNLGFSLHALGDIAEAESALVKAIELKPDFAEANTELGCIMYEKGDEGSALQSFKEAFRVNSGLRINELRLLTLKSKMALGQNVDGINNSRKIDSKPNLNSIPLVLNRVVEKDLIKSIYKMNSRFLDSTNDGRYGEGSCSVDFDLFKDEGSIIKKVSSDLIRIMSDAVKSKVYIYDSFFNILEAGGGTIPHNHILSHDKPMSLGEQKYSLVYYLSIGDQKCNEPGFLKLYNPDENILPCEGMIVIIPAKREHSAVYNGKADRVMIGVNFYAL